MRDLFDEFMEELRRRQEAAERRARGEPDATGEPDGGAEPDSGGEPAAKPEPGAGGVRPAPAEPLDEHDLDEDEAEEDEEPPVPIGRSGGGGGGRRRGRFGRGGASAGAIGRRIALAAVLLVVLVLLALIGFGLDLWTDAIWFTSVGFDAVFWTRVGTQFWLFVAVLVLALAVLFGNVWLAGRLAGRHRGQGGALRGWATRLNEASSRPRGGLGGPFERRTRGGRRGGPWAGSGGWPGEGPIWDEDVPDLSPLALLGLVALAVLVALGIAGGAAGQWETFLLWRNQVPFSVDAARPVVDPVFGRDIGFYLFELPFLRLVQGIATTLVVGALLAVGARYAIAAARDGLEVATPVRVHLGVLGALVLASFAVGYQLDKFELVYSTNGAATGVATGVSYTDQAARFLALDVLTVVAALAAAFLVGGAFTRWLWPLGGAVAVWLGASFLLGSVYPEVIQRLVVAPSPFDKEQPYISNTISMTRLAYGIDWTQLPYDGSTPLTASQVGQEAATFQNARLWDYRPLGTTLDQLQTVRQYYTFPDVDTDRYVLDGDLRQVMLAPRELDASKIPQAQNWLNERIIYTHGIGVVMAPVNEVVGQGQPQLVISNLPPTSTGGAPQVSQPRIYFGQTETDWVVTGARQSEFDIPVGGGGSVPAPGPSASASPAGSAAGSPAPGASAPPVSVSGETGSVTRWTGTTGIKLDTMLSRLLFAARFRDLNLLISDQVTADSQLLMHRSLSDRLSRIAPFLRYDKDPYLVVRADGRLAWIQDAYTVSDRFPMSQPFDPGDLAQNSGLLESPFNYIRNSVKVVVDAYDGTTTFYAADPTDPILRDYEGVFPGMFQPLSSMPADLRAHIRYPEELFDVQTTQYGTYHVTDPLTFFQRDDVWKLPTATANTQTLPPEAYYVVMRLPDQPQPEFLLLQPMIPASRPNMIAWVAARSDGANYGTVRVYHFPADTTVLGPAQIEGLIDEDPVISAQITLWNQSGSQVIRGNLIVVPVANSLIYLQPVYLQSTGSAFPQFQKIVVASPTRVVWGNTLADALNQLLAAGPASPPPSPSPPGPSPSASPPSASPSPSTGPGPTPPGDVASLVAYANAHFEAAQAALRAGDFARYGQEIELVRQALARLEVLTGGSPAPSAASPGSTP